MFLKIVWNGSYKLEHIGEGRRLEWKTSQMKSTLYWDLSQLSKDVMEESSNQQNHMKIVHSCGEYSQFKVYGIEKYPVYLQWDKCKIISMSLTKWSRAGPWAL